MPSHARAMPRFRGHAWRDPVVTPGADILGRLDALRAWPYPRRVLVVIGAAWFFAFFDIVNIGYALPVISDQFGVSSTMAALAVTIGLVGYIVGSLSDGLVADRFGRRPALVISVVAFSVGTIIAALAPDLSVLLVGRFIAGMGIGAEIAAATAYVGEIAPASLRGRAASPRRSGMSASRWCRSWPWPSCRASRPGGGCCS